ncbi:MAG: peptidylprolyl isomerase [Methylococcaceae bacterium]|nr:peptidylprolyl isomerase [Methylococcaceae bacterium]
MKLSKVPPESMRGNGINAPAISVNDVPISERDIAQEMQYHPADSREKAYVLAARALVVRELLLQQAASKGIGEITGLSDTETRDEARVRLLIEQEVETPHPDEIACRTYYKSNPGRFKTPPLIQARHILIPAAPKNLEGRRAAKQLADRILEQLCEDPSLFAELAKQHSVCPSKNEGGNLGQISKGQTTPEFERQLFALPEGLAGRPVETRYGYHVVDVQHKLEGRPLEYDQVAGKIAGYLNERVRRKAVSQYIHYLIGAANIKGIDMQGADTPLMQ